MARHLTALNAATALRRGREIEQLLGFDVVEGRRTVRWLTIAAESGGFGLREHHVFDEGADDFVDVSEFAPVDDDEYVGEGRTMGSAPTPEEALTLATERHGARPDRWVNQGMIGDEYADSRR